MHSVLQTKTEKEKGDCFELLTKYALKLIPKYKSQLKNVWLNDELPTHEREYLNQAIVDIGTDIIAQTNSGEYWAIQWNAYCKSGKKPKNIPNAPNQVYKNNGWVGVGVWLGK